MPTRKNGKTQSIRGIEVKTSEIFVAKSRSSDPFIRSFIAAPENVTQENLGTLVGIFSVSDRSESSGFVVNELISSVKKEYFAAPRRGAIESFEAGLHRMNIRLSELVKNGKVEWVGNLHGTVAVIEKHSLHFSVTGAGRILLFRSGSLSDISDGLASEEASVHPMKTFVEISSGRISPNDCILLASPEVFTLFSDSELERSARRLLPDRRFSRFLETAMTNDLRQGAAIVLSAEERTESATPEKPTVRPKRAEKKAPNLFSADAFKKAAEARASIFEEELPSLVAPIDPEPRDAARTGAIYVQGEEPDGRTEHPIVTKLRWTLEDTATSFRHLKERFYERVRQRKESTIVAVSGAVSASLSKARRLIGKTPPTYRETAGTTRKDEPAPKEHAESTPRKIPKWHVPKIRIPEKISSASRLSVNLKKRIPAIPADRMRAAVSAFVFGWIIPMIRTSARYAGIAGNTLMEAAAKAFASLKRRFLALPPKRQLLVASVIAFSLTLGGIFIWSTLTHESETDIPTIVAEAPKKAFPPEGEHNARLADPETVAETADPIVTPVFLKGTLLLVMENGILDTGQGKSFPVPSASPIRYAVGMDDLNLVFLMTEEGRLFAFAPSNRSFVENNLRLPPGFTPAGIGTFLTYLYVLEEGTGRIYRFPRAEGGFGEGVEWTKTALDRETRAIAVSENIYGAHPSGIQSFSRGSATDPFSQELPTAPLSPDGICANEETPERFGVIDSHGKRVILYGTDGHIITQYFHESFSEASACALSRDGSSMAVSLGKQASLIRLAGTDR